jgi:hypothetical protein
MIKAFSSVMLNCNAAPWHHDTSRSPNLNSERRRRLFLSVHFRKRAYLKVRILRKVNTESPVLHVHHLVKVSYEVKCVSVANIRVHSTGILVSETLIACRADPGGSAV